MENKLVVNVIGGLCNRLRTIAAGVHIARVTGRRLTIIWNNNKDLKADFDTLFHPLPESIELRDPGNIAYALKYEVARKRNLYLSSIYQKMAFKATFSDAFSLTEYLDKDDQFCDAVASTSGDVLIISGSAVGGFAPEEFRTLFRPLPSVMQLVEEKTSGFNANTIGVHIRRSDNVSSINQSPLQLFIDEMNSRVKKTPDAKFFVASDDLDTINQLTDIFGDRIISGDKNASRTTTSGMIEATADLWALSKTRGVIGSFRSSYSHTAALIGDIPLKVVSLCGRAW